MWAYRGYAAGTEPNQHVERSPGIPRRQRDGSEERCRSSKSVNGLSACFRPARHLTSLRAYSNEIHIGRHIQRPSRNKRPLEPRSAEIQGYKTSISTMDNGIPIRGRALHPNDMKGSCRRHRRPNPDQGGRNLPCLGAEWRLESEGREEAQTPRTARTRLSRGDKVPAGGVS